MTSAALVIVAIQLTLNYKGCGGSWPMPGQNSQRQNQAKGGRAGLARGAVGKWTFPLSGHTSVSVGGPVTSPDDSVVYVQADGVLHAMGASQGDHQWSATMATSGDASSPVISPDGSVIYLQTEQGDLLHAVSVFNGSSLWTYHVGSCDPLPAYVYTWSPALSPSGDVIYVTGSRDFMLHAVKTTDGTGLWKTQLRGRSSSMVTSHPAVSADGAVVYVSATNIGNPWGSPPGDSQLFGVDATDGSVLWTYAPYDGYMMSPVPTISPDGEVVYVGTESEQLHAVNASDGALLWKYKGVRGTSSVAVSADGAVVYGSGRHTLHAIDAGNGTQIWTYTAPNFQRHQNSYTLAASHWSEPSISADGGTIFIATRGVYENVGNATFLDFNQVHAINLADGARKWTYPPSIADVLEDKQYLDSLTYIAISGDGNTLYTAERETFDEHSFYFQPYARPTFLHAIDITACDASGVLVSFAGAGDCVSTMPSGSSCAPLCPPNSDASGHVICNLGMLFNSFSCVRHAPCDANAVMPANGGRGNCSRELDSGSMCTPTCDVGHTGSGHVTCHVGTLSNTFSCNPHACDLSGELTNYSDAGDCTSTLPSGFSCTPSCSYGYTAVGSINCSAGDVESDFFCMENSCEGMTDLPKNGRIGGCNVPLAGGSFCKPECFDGYTSSGVVQCTKGSIMNTFRCTEDACEIGGLISTPGNCTIPLLGSSSCTPGCGAGEAASGSLRCSAGVLHSDFICIPLRLADAPAPASVPTTEPTKAEYVAPTTNVSTTRSADALQDAQRISNEEAGNETKRAVDAVAIAVSGALTHVLCPTRELATSVLLLLALS